MEHDFVFIVSGGRTGTQFFGDLLSEMIEGAYSVHEPDLANPLDVPRMSRAIRQFGLWHMVVGRALGLTGIRNLSQRRIQGKLSSAAAIEAIRRQRTPYYDTIAAPLIVESYPQWYGLIPEVRALRPEAKFAGILRDPRDWVKSWLDHGGHHSWRDLTALFGQRRLSPRDTGQTELAARWSEASEFEKHCWDWKMYNEPIVAAADTDPLVKVWKFEDLFLGASDAPMKELLAFAAEHGERSYRVNFDAGLRSDKRNASRGSAPRWEEWSAEQARILDSHCGPLMRRFGYGDEPEWREKLTAAA